MRERRRVAGVLQLLMTVAAMGGHFGKPSNACSNDQYYSAFNAGPKLATQPPIGSPWQYNPANPIIEGISASMVWDAVLTGKYWYAGNDLRGVFEPGVKGKYPIQVTNVHYLRRADRFQPGHAHQGVHDRSGLRTISGIGHSAKK